MMKYFLTLIITIFIVQKNFSQKTRPVLDRTTYDGYFATGFKQAEELFIKNDKFKFEKSGRYDPPYRMEIDNKMHPSLPNAVGYRFMIIGKKKKLLNDTEILVKDILNRLGKNYQFKKGLFVDFPKELKKLAHAVMYNRSPGEKYPFYIFQHKEDTSLVKNMHPIVIVTFDHYKKKEYECNIIFACSYIKMKNKNDARTNYLQQYQNRINDLENSFTETPSDYENIFFETLYDVLEKGTDNNFNIYKGDLIKYIKFDYNVGDFYTSNFSWPYAANTIINSNKYSDYQYFMPVFIKSATATKNIFKKYANKYTASQKEAIIKLNSSKEISIVKAEYLDYLINMHVKIKNHYYYISGSYYKKSKKFYLFIDYEKDFLENYLENQQKIEEDLFYSNQKKQRKKYKDELPSRSHNDTQLAIKRDIRLSKRKRVRFKSKSNESKNQSYYGSMTTSRAKTYIIDVYVPNKLLLDGTYLINQYPIINFKFNNKHMDMSRLKNNSKIFEYKEFYKNNKKQPFYIKHYKLHLAKGSYSFTIKNAKDCHVLTFISF